MRKLNSQMQIGFIPVVRISAVIGFGLLLTLNQAGASLVAYWDMNEPPGATVALDSVGGTYTADAVAGGDSFPQAGAVGISGTAWSFDHSNDNRLTVLPPNQTDFTTLGFAGFSYSGWINTTHGIGADTIFSISDAAAASEEANLRLNGNVLNFLGRHNTNPNVDITGTTNVADGQWHHVAVASDSSGTVLYLDGVPEATDPSNGVDIATFTTNNNNLSVNFGANNDNGSGLQWEYSGVIDEFGVYDHKLTPAEVTALAVPPAQTLPSLVINRNDGNATLSNLTVAPYQIAGYSILSEAGSLNPANGVWTSIAENYDHNGGTTPGNGSVDPNDEWIELTSPSSRNDLSELEPDGDGATFSDSQNIDLGNVWLKSPREDVTAELLLDGGAVQPVFVSFINGPGGLPYVVGDLDFDGDFDVMDFTAEFVPSFGTNTSGFSSTEKYRAGDFNLDNIVDEFDFLLYNEAYLAANPMSAPLVLSVPEPTTYCMALLAAVGFAGLRRKWDWRTPTRHGIALLLVTAIVSACSQCEAAGLLAQWKLDEAGSATTAVDSTGNGHTGTAAGAATSGSPGIIGNAWDFAGADTDYISVTTTPGTLTGLGNAFSISGWVKTADANLGSLFSISDNTEPSEEVLFRAVSSEGGLGLGVVDLVGRPGIAPGAAVSTTKVNDDQWHFLVFAQNATGWSLYVDGVEEDSGLAIDGLANPSAIGANAIHIGMNEDSGGTQWGLDGLIDDLAVWSDRLTEIETRNLLLAGLNGVDAGTSFTADLSLVVTENTGSVELRNESGFDFEIDLYRIRSVDNHLTPGTWKSLDASGFDANAWTALGSTADKVSEGVFGGSSTIVDAVTPIDLGKLYDETFNTKDLIFEYHVAGTASTMLFEGDVSYAIGAVNDADFDNDTDVDGADFLIWQRGFNSFAGGAGNTDGDANDDGFVDSVDLTIWEGQYGTTLPAVATVTAVPEPASSGLSLLAILAFAATTRVRRRSSLSTAAALFIAVTLPLFLSGVAKANVFVDRQYTLGETPVEGALLGAVIGSGNGLDVAVDGADGPSSGDQQNLNVVGNPTYADVSSRPGASFGHLGGSFDGVDDYLITPINLAVPDQVWNNTNYFSGTPFPEDFSGINVQGMQMWVKPNGSTQNVRQDIIKNSGEHGISITVTNNWGLVADVPTPIDSGVAVSYDQWSHVMHVSGINNITNGASMSGGALFVNGVIVGAKIATYEFHEEQSLTIGAMQFESDLNGTPSTPEAFYHGLVDDVEIFLWGTNNNAVPQDFGTFNAGTDNDWIASQLVGIPDGDINLDGQVYGDGSGDSATDDVSALIDGWLSIRTIDGVQLGDWTSRQDGDLNFDGIVDLNDAFILREGLILSGLGVLDFSLLHAVPEPTGLSLSIMAMLLGFALRRRAKHHYHS